MKPPATKTRLPMTSMSQISPSVIIGMLVRGVSGHEPGVTRAGGFGAGVVAVAGRRGGVAVPSSTVSVTVRVPAVA